MASRQAVHPIHTKTTILQTQAEQRNRLLDDYFFESTKLLQVIEDFTTGLATTFKTQLRLPANPYPELLKTIRLHELRQSFVLQGESCSSGALELTLLGGQASIPEHFQVCSVEHEQFALRIWGVQSTLEQLTGANLYGLLELLNSTFRGLVTSKEFTDDECQATAYGVLVGNSIFGARFHDLQPCFLELETHVFVSGLHLEKTMAVFVRFLIKQLREASNAAAFFASLPAEKAMAYRGCVLCDGISIPPQTSPSIELSTQDVIPIVWTIDRVLESRVAFTNAVKTALVSNSLITINRYDSTQLSNSNGSCLCQVEQAFFFHFSMLEGGKTVNSTKNTTSRRSFIIGSQASTSGVFFDSKGALEVAARFRAVTQAALEEDRKTQSQKKKQATFPKPEDAITLSGARLRSGYFGILQDMINSLRQIGLANEAFRHPMNNLVGCFAYSLGYLVGAHEVLENIVCRPGCAASMIATIQASFAVLETRMRKCMEDASLQTSLLHPVCPVLSHFYSELQAASVLETEQHVDEFAESLRCVNEFLLIVIRVAFNDFLRLVRASEVKPAGSATLNTPEAQLNEDHVFLQEIDVLRSLEVAIEERKYPAAILSEAVFAQAVVDSCLDVALESAVMNTVAVGLPPNPFIDMSKNLQVFAVRQLVWSQALEPTPSNVISNVTRPGLQDVFLLEGTNVCAANPRLLQLVSGKKIIQACQWLMDHHILHEGTYKPSKSSYSAAIFPLILAFHPLVFAQARSTEDVSFLKELDIVEHYVLEGKDHAQARSFFIEAVCRDLRRIGAVSGTSTSSTGNNCWQLLVKAHVIGSHGQIVAVLDLSSLTADNLLVATLEEATQKRLGVQVVIQIAELLNQGTSTHLTIHKVTKTYVFHHHSTDHHETAQSSTLISPLMSFRVLKYGVFLSKENALLCLQTMESDRQDSEIPRGEWTPYASQALQHQDSLLIYELNIMHKSASHSSPQQHRESELFSRLLMYSNIWQLYSLEQAVRWLLDAMQFKLQQITLQNSRNEDVSTGLHPPTVFSIHHRLVLQIIAQVEQLVVPLNQQLQFVHQLSDTLANFRQNVARWQSIQSPTEEQLELNHKQQEKTPGIVVPTPRGDPANISSELVDSLRTTWQLLLFFRVSYQRALFACADSRTVQEETTISIEEFSQKPK